MKKQIRLSPVVVALSLFASSIPSPVLAQVRVQTGAGAASVPAVPALGGSILPSAGSLETRTGALGLTGSLAAPSAAPTPLTTVVPALAPAALIAAPAAAAKEVPAAAIVVRTPGAAATGVAAEAAAYHEGASFEVPAAAAPAAKPVEKSFVGRALDALMRRPAASVSFDGSREKVAPIFGLRETNWAAGAMYVTGPWLLSGDFRQAHRARDGSGATFDKVERLTFQTAYRLAPGVNLGGALFKSFQRDTVGMIWRSRGAIIGITIGF